MRSALCLIAFAAAHAVSTALAGAPGKAERPNFVFILGEGDGLRERRNPVSIAGGHAVGTVCQVQAILSQGICGHPTGEGFPGRGAGFNTKTRR